MPSNLVSTYTVARNTSSVTPKLLQAKRNNLRNVLYKSLITHVLLTEEYTPKRVIYFRGNRLLLVV